MAKAQATNINIPNAVFYCTAEQLPALLGQLATVSTVNMPNAKFVILKEPANHPEPKTDKV